MTLNEFLQIEGITPAEFGRMLGLKSRSSVFRYLTGQRVPKPEVMKKIKELTNGKVTANSFHQ